MPRTVISDLDMAQIISQRDRGIPIKDIASNFKVNRTAIYKRLEAVENEGRLGKKKVERSIKATASDLQAIKKKAKDDPFATLQEIKQDLNLNLTLTTISKYHKRFGLGRGVSPRKFALSDSQRDDRVALAIRRANWTVDDWKNIAFLDESCIDNSGSQRRFVVRPRGERFNQKFIYKAPNANRKFNFLSYVSSHGPGKMFFYEKMNSQEYCNIIPIVIEDLQEKFGHQNFKIIRDNARFHTSQEVTLFISRNGLANYFMDITPYSPDMNIIENMFGWLKQSVRQKCFQEGQERDREEFREIVIETWLGTEQKKIENLYKSLPRRMRTIVSSLGYLTRY